MPHTSLVHSREAMEETMEKLERYTQWQREVSIHSPTCISMHSDTYILLLSHPAVDPSILPATHSILVHSLHLFTHSASFTCTPLPFTRSLTHMHPFTYGFHSTHNPCIRSFTDSHLLSQGPLTSLIFILCAFIHSFIQVSRVDDLMGTFTKGIVEEKLRFTASTSIHPHSSIRPDPIHPHPLHLNHTSTSLHRHHTFTCLLPHRCSALGLQ